VPGKKFVIYMGDDQNNEALYKFVSDRSYIPGDRANNLKILESGTLYVARWEPEGRRRFTAQGQTEPITVAVTRVKGHKATGSRAIPRRRRKR